MGTLVSGSKFHSGGGWCGWRVGTCGHAERLFCSDKVSVEIVKSFASILSCTFSTFS